MEASLKDSLWPSVAAVLLPAALLAAPPAPPAEQVEWVVEEGSNLLLRVVMEEGRKACGAVLTVDPTRRRVRFEGIPGELGCRRVLEGTFSEVKTLRAQRREAGFILEFDKPQDKAAKLVLLPLPHFKWFERQFDVKKGGAEIDQALAASGGAVSAGPDGGDAFSFGGVTGSGASATSVERVEIPKDVQADTQKAVDLIRDAMGRQPAPAEMLREVLQGRPVDASVAELLQEPGGFASSPVRVRARLARAGADEGFRLEEEGAALAIVPEPTAEARFAAASAWIGKDVEVLGRLKRAADAPDGAVRGSEYYLAAWECIGPDVAATAEGKPVTLSVLLAGMTDYEGEVVRVVGRFRGRNLYGDLPGRSQRGTSDWVIKSERAAVWVTGHKPGGEGWGLNIETPGNGEWLEVVGRPRVRDGVAYVQAMKVALVAAPRGARVVPPRRLLSSTPTDPPSVVFSLPLEGEAIETGTRIVVQFDRAMDEESFKERVRLREEAGAEIGVQLMYDESRRSLVVSPVRAPPPGRRVRVELLPGIVDVDGVPLAPRPGREAEGEIVDVLRYDVAGS
jgi:hypothetical protein